MKTILFCIDTIALVIENCIAGKVILYYNMYILLLLGKMVGNRGNGRDYAEKS